MRVYRLKISAFIGLINILLCGFLIINILYWSPEPYSKDEGPYIMFFFETRGLAVESISGPAVWDFCV